MKNTTKLHPDMKMVELIHLNPGLLDLLYRLHINLGFKDLSINDICQQHGVSLNFFMMMAKLYVEKRVAIPEAIERRSFANLIRFLRNSHDYILNNKIIEIDMLIKAYSTSNENGKQELLERFWSEYVSHIHRHMGYENHEIFPIIQLLYEGKSTSSIDPNFILQFEENHDDIEEALADLKNLLIKYFPPTSKEELRHQILKELFVLDDDLQIHQQVENHILIPLVKKFTQEKYSI